MKKLAPPLVLLLAVLAGLAYAGNDLQEEVRRHPGFVDFGDLGLFSDEELEIAVSVKGPLIRLVAATTRRSDPELAELLDGLAGIEVQVYDTAESKRPAVRQKIAQLAERLSGEGWEAALTIRVERSFGYVFLRLVEGEPQGLAAMLLGDDDEAVFLNVIGRVDPDQLGRLAAKFHLQVLEDERLRGGGDEKGGGDERP